jgi:hypothetical protein
MPSRKVAVSAGLGKAPAQLGAHGGDEQAVAEAGKTERGGGTQRQPRRPPPA